MNGGARKPKRKGLPRCQQLSDYLLSSVPGPTESRALPSYLPKPETSLGLESVVKMEVLNTPQSANREKVLRIGCAGWTIPREFSASFSAQGTHLERYARVLNCTEINSSFYRPHKPQTWARWKASVPSSFLFSVKAPKAITHEARLDCARQDLVAFVNQLTGLEEKLGPLLFQLPPSLQFDESRARTFLSTLRELYSGNVVWEPRHESWFHSEADELLKAFSIARVAADPACVPAAGRPGGCTSLCYYRLHGSPRRYYSAYTIESLTNLAAEISGGTAVHVWCIFDNTASGAAISNALDLAEGWPRFVSGKLFSHAKSFHSMYLL